MSTAAEKDLPACSTRYSAMLHAEFIAPVLRGHPVVVSVDGVCRRIQIVPPTFQGWGVGRLLSPSIGFIVREADAQERQALVERWAPVSLHICHVSDHEVIAMPLFGDERSICVSLRLCDAATEKNDVVLARFDGSQYWFDRTVARGFKPDGPTLCAKNAAHPDLDALTFAANVASNRCLVH